MKRQNLRTVSLIVVTFTYLLIGAAIFGYLESDNERIQKELLGMIEGSIQRRYGISDDDLSVLTTALLKSVPHKAGIQWKFPGAFYFATTVVTTIGYGHSTPSTTSGRCFCMIYALIGIPLGLVMFQSIGERLNTFVRFVLKYAKQCFKAKNPEVTQTNLVAVVSVLSTILMTSMAAVFATYERWDYLDALYYCFITLTTIGFGDFVALQKDSALQEKPQYVVLSLVFILFGLSVVSSAVNLLVLKFLTLNTEDERRDEQLRYTANLNPILLEGDVITPASRYQHLCANNRKYNDDGADAADTDTIMRQVNDDTSSSRRSSAHHQHRHQRSHQHHFDHHHHHHHHGHGGSTIDNMNFHGQQQDNKRDTNLDGEQLHHEDDQHRRFVVVGSSKASNQLLSCSNSDCPANRRAHHHQPHHHHRHHDRFKHRRQVRRDIRTVEDAGINLESQSRTAYHHRWYCDHQSSLCDIVEQHHYPLADRCCQHYRPANSDHHGQPVHDFSMFKPHNDQQVKTSGEQVDRKQIASCCTHQKHGQQGSRQPLNDGDKLSTTHNSAQHRLIGGQKRPLLLSSSSSATLIHPEASRKAHRQQAGLAPNEQPSPQTNDRLGPLSDESGQSNKKEANREKPILQTNSLSWLSMVSLDLSGPSLSSSSTSSFPLSFLNCGQRELVSDYLQQDLALLPQAASTTNTTIADYRGGCSPNPAGASNEQPIWRSDPPEVHQESRTMGLIGHHNSSCLSADNSRLSLHLNPQLHGLAASGSISVRVCSGANKVGPKSGLGAVQRLACKCCCQHPQCIQHALASHKTNTDKVSSNYYARPSQSKTGDDQKDRRPFWTVNSSSASDLRAKTLGQNKHLLRRRRSESISATKDEHLPGTGNGQKSEIFSIETSSLKFQLTPGNNAANSQSEEQNENSNR